MQSFQLDVLRVNATDSRVFYRLVSRERLSLNICKMMSLKQTLNKGDIDIVHVIDVRLLKISIYKIYERQARNWIEWKDTGLCTIRWCNINLSINIQSHTIFNLLNFQCRCQNAQENKEKKAYLNRSIRRWLLWVQRTHYDRVTMTVIQCTFHI